MSDNCYLKFVINFYLLQKDLFVYQAFLDNRLCIIQLIHHHSLDLYLNLKN